MPSKYTKLCYTDHKLGVYGRVEGPNNYSFLEGSGNHLLRPNHSVDSDVRFGDELKADPGPVSSSMLSQTRTY